MMLLIKRGFCIKTNEKIGVTNVNWQRENSGINKQMMNDGDIVSAPL